MACSVRLRLLCLVRFGDNEPETKQHRYKNRETD